MKRSSKISFVVTIVFLFIASGSRMYAQSIESKAGKDDMIIGIGLNGGFSTFSLDGINNALATEGVPTLKKNCYVGGVTLYLMDKDDRFFIDLTYSGGASKKDNGVIYVRQTYETGVLNFNYYIFKKGRHYLYPGIGVGIMSCNVALDRALPVASFNQAFSSFTDEHTSVSAPANYYANLKIAYDYALDKDARMLLGARAIYRIGITNQDWKVGPALIGYPASPTQSASGFACAISLTFRGVWRGHSGHRG